jgi:hypothetical protein
MNEISTEGEMIPHLLDLIHQYPAFGLEVKEEMVHQYDEKGLNLLCEAISNTGDWQCGFSLFKRDGQFIHDHCDAELCYRLGVTTSQLINHPLSEMVLPASCVAAKTTYYERAWSGEIVDYIGVGKTGCRYLARLTPVRENGHVSLVEGKVKFHQEMKAKFVSPVNHLVDKLKQRLGHAQIYAACFGYFLLDLLDDGLLDNSIIGKMIELIN